MRGAVPALLILLVACSSGSVDLDVATSVLDIETTTTSTMPPSTVTTMTVGPTTTTEPAPQPIVPAAATVIPLRPLLLADDAGTRVARVSSEQVAEWVTFANRVFAPARFGFSFDPGSDLEVVRDSLVNGVQDTRSARWLRRAVRGNEIAGRYPGELVVFFSGAGGEEIGSHHLNFVVIGDDETMCGDPDPGLLAHRIGLYLALSHTFARSHGSSADAADTLSDALQDRAAFDGDGFGDTAPDPGVHDEHQCSSDESVRIGGIDFDLPRGNIMSHYRERGELTLEQIERARWALDLRAANEMAAPSNTIVEDILEAEDLLAATRGPCGFGSVQRMGRWVGYQWAGLDQMVVPSADGCVLDFEIPVESAGRYEIVALATRAPDHGAVEFLVDGERFRLEDLYAPVVVASGPISIGETNLEAGSIVISVDVVGTNARSTGSKVGIDGFALRPLGR